MSTIKALTLGEAIARALRQDVLLGKIRPGTRVTQDDLSAEYKVSRMPARDAMRQLLTEGLLRQEGRIVRVAALTEVDVREMLEIDAFLHGLAARGAAQRADDGFARDLLELQADVDRRLEKGDVTGAATANWSFHRHINRHGASPHLQAMMRFISTPREHIAEVVVDSDAIQAQHGRIVSAILEGRADDAQAEGYAHVLASIDDRVAHLKSLNVIVDERRPDIVRGLG